jgi:hypothetical protein
VKYLLLLGLVTLVACSKTADRQTSSAQEDDNQRCDFGIKQFNLSKRAPVNNNNEVATKRPPKPPGGTTPPPSNAGVILLDFDGHFVSGTMWNSGGTDFTCAPANVTIEDASVILQRVTNDYSPFNITVTTDEAVYNAANSLRRTRVVITESWEWYGQAGGAAFLNTFMTGTSTPCFVFSSLLGYNVKSIAEASSHEAGHTLGLRHQSSYDANCVKISEYNAGQGSGEIGWAPIMGNSYSRNLSLWHKGPNSINCSTIQDDVAIIANVVGYKTDDYSNSTASAAALASSLAGCVNNSNDLDFFSLNLSTTKTVSLIPVNVGINNAGANLDLILKIYNSQGSLLASYDTPAILNTSTVLAPGNYFVSVGTVANTYATTYGMLGKYNISLY